WLDTALDELKKVLQHVDVLTINDEEARQLSGKFSLVKAAASIHKMGPKVIVVKKGEHGALLFQNSNVFFAPALPLAEIFDPTGAGDTFAGGFIGYLASTEDLSFENMKRAVIYGSAMASFCVEKFSITRLKEINDDQITERMVNFVQLVNFDAKL
ncbi:MAG: bifunctional hydroxymethylpyrimidine kinase/phosphomethylpyrimidine kinase, partial [Ignavibacteriae bacterium]|nr:bifunctional hydroxymethylpyrimidine kinase/phosphomethylpyrimidine kinase [Ignavibacteriota bacterium]